MAAKEKYRSDIARSVHRTVRGLRRIGLVDRKTMRRFDASCLTRRSKRLARKRFSLSVSAKT